MAVDWLAGLTLLDGILGCVCAQLDATRDELAALPVPVIVDGCPDRHCVVVGPPSWEHCTCGGELVVYLERRGPTGNFPEDELEPDCSTLRLGLVVGIRLLRCACPSEEDGSPPPCSCHVEVATQIEADMAAVLMAVQCCVGNLGEDPYDEPSVQLLDQSPLGPSGACVGHLTRIAVDLDVCAC